MRLVIDKYKVITDKKIEKPLKFILISDIHFSKHPILANNINPKSSLKGIKKIRNIDGFVFCGDFVNTARDLLNKTVVKNFQKHLEELGKIAPVFLTRGNHDFYRSSERTEEIYQNFGKIKNVFLLDNKQVDFSGITITGFVPNNDAYELLMRSRKKMTMLAAENYRSENFRFNPDKFNLIMTHSPHIFSNEKMLELLPDFYKKCDLVLSGHLHNGLAVSGNSEKIKNKINTLIPDSKMKKFVLKNIDVGFWTDARTGFHTNNCRGAKIICDDKVGRTILPSSKKYEIINLRKDNKKRVAQIVGKGINKFSVMPIIVGRPSVVEVIIRNE